MSEVNTKTKKDYCPFFIILLSLALILSSVVAKHNKNNPGNEHTDIPNVNNGCIVNNNDNNTTTIITKAKKVFFFICLRFKGLLLRKVINATTKNKELLLLIYFKVVASASKISYLEISSVIFCLFIAQSCMSY